MNKVHGILNFIDSSTKEVLKALNVPFEQGDDLNTETAGNVHGEYLLIKSGNYEVTSLSLPELQGDELFIYPRGVVYLEGNSSRFLLTEEMVFGSVRSDHFFGPLVLINRRKVMEKGIASLYEAQLHAQEENDFALRADFEVSYRESENTSEHAKHFAYLSGDRRAHEVRMEEIFTEFAKKKGFYLPERKQEFKSTGSFPVTASVIIPVKNRAGKIGDAVKSALNQKASFSFNVIVVDNYSSDGTTEEISELAACDNRVVHIIPEVKHLFIGGCWNLAVHSPHCGEFAVQLDSDDLYAGEDVLERIVSTLRSERGGALVGSYTIVDESLNVIPPGLIDHREWSSENGHNNAIRINGLGAPRAFPTELLREIKVPNLPYGEDYYLMLSITGNYKISRIYDSLYWCRRWGGNSDSGLTHEKKIVFSLLKDTLRGEEIKARRSRV